MSTTMTAPRTLPELVAKAMTRHKVSTHSELVEKTGADIHPATLAKLAEGQYQRKPARGTLEVLATLADVSYEQVRDIVDSDGRYKALDPTDDVNRRVGAYLQRHRKALGLTQDQVAERMRDAGFPWESYDVVKRLESGWGRELHLAEMPALARALGFNPADLLALVGDRAAPSAPQEKRRPGRPRLGAFPPDLSPGLAARGQSARLPGWSPWAGQIERLEALTKALDVARQQALASCLELGLEDYEAAAATGDPEEMQEMWEASRRGAVERAGGQQ